VSNRREFSWARAGAVRCDHRRAQWSSLPSQFHTDEFASTANLHHVVFLVRLIFCFSFAACGAPLPESISVGKDPIHPATTPDGSQLFVANDDDNRVSVTSLGGTDPVRVTTIHVDGRPNPMLVPQDGKTVYVGLGRGRDAAAVKVFETKRKRHYSIPTGGPVWDMGLSVDGTSIYFAMEWNGFGKLRLRDSSVAIVWPEDLAITSKGYLFVSYQFTASGIGVLATMKDRGFGALKRR
jgi:hypothetical protein